MPTLPARRRAVTEIPAALPARALDHFQRLLELETDCWDVSAAMADGPPGFVLLDVRDPRRFAAGHLPGAVNLPYGLVTERNLAQYPAETLFVVYCDGPHCNGADRAALRLARLGRPVKKMIGGVTAWISTIVTAAGQPALRACVTSYRTSPRHIEILVDALAVARSS